MQSSLATQDLQSRDPSDSELIRQVTEGDATGFATLVQRHRDRLYDSMRRDVGCPTTAEDIVQDAFVKAFLSLGSFRNESSFYTWLYRVALNCRRRYRNSNTRREYLHGSIDREGLGGSHERTGTALDRIERREERSHVRLALSRLEEPHREIIVLREFEGFDYKTIAEILQVRVGTVRSRLARARAQLKRELLPYLRPDHLATCHVTPL